MTIREQKQHVDVLEPGAKTTLTCPISTEPMQDEIKIDAWITYSIPFGIHRCKAETFQGKAAAGRTYVWTYHGSAACDSK
jgi:hypothetical protein